MRGSAVFFGLAFALGASASWAQMDMNEMHHGDGQNMMHEHETDANGELIHDEVTMPGLIGRDTSEAEVEALRELFQNHGKLTRSVKILPNGIETLTESDDEELVGYLQSHVHDMIGRVEENRDPAVPIQSQTLDGIFLGYEDIETKIEDMPSGVLVIQTSEDPELVAMLQTHAREIDAMVAGGMQAVHERMAREMAARQQN